MFKHTQNVYHKDGISWRFVSQLFKLSFNWLSDNDISFPHFSFVCFPIEGVEDIAPLSFSENSRDGENTKAGFLLWLKERITTIIKV